MSLAIAFKGSEGVVLAADSRVTLQYIHKPDPNSPDQFLVPATYDNATKLLKVAGQEHVAAVTYDQGAIGQTEPRTAHSLMPEFEAEIASAGRLSVQDFAIRLSAFFAQQWQARMPQAGGPFPNMRFIVAGYDEGAAYGRLFEMAIPDAPNPVETLVSLFGIRWGGQYEIASRMLNGHDWSLMGFLKSKHNLDDNQTNDLRVEIESKCAAAIPYQFLPLQDCIDLSILLVKTTSQLMDFQTHIRGVGGAIDVATITRPEGFRYLQRKELRGETSRI